MMADLKTPPSRMAQVLLWVVLIVPFCVFTFLTVVGPPWKRFMPPEGMETIDDLIARLPETYRFAAVEHDGQAYVVWVGRPRGVIVSGPPVCVFDAEGRLVDWSADTGDSTNRFVREMHALANQSKPIDAKDAAEFCRQ